MASNGAGRPGEASPRHRIDPLPGPGATAAPLPPGVSGRRVVLALAAAVLLIWAGLSLAMRGWRARYDALAAHGRATVAPAVDPLGPLAPPGVDPASWRGAVADTHAMLVALTAASLLDRDQMDALAADLRARVARARPDTAVADLSRIWDDLEARAGPVIAPSAEAPPPGSRHAARVPRPPRPALMARRPAPTG